MTSHYFENDLVNLHYYKFGNGPQAVLCFHGYGMHGRQFKVLEADLGAKYTFYGFDLFFHKETKLKDQRLEIIKKGVSKKELAKLLLDFCKDQGINRFSVLGYSMGTHYAATIVEELSTMIDKFIVAAPMFLYPGRLIKYFSRNKTGNKILEKIALSEKGLVNLLNTFKQFGLVNSEAYSILYNEIGTAELRFNLYATFTYLRFLETDEPHLLKVLEAQNIKSIFIFGKRDKSFPPGIGKDFIKKLNNTDVVILDEGHDMIKKNFAATLTSLL